MDVESDDNFPLLFLLFRVIELQRRFIIMMSTYVSVELQSVADFIDMLLISCKVNNFPAKNPLSYVEIYG